MQPLTKFGTIKLITATCPACKRVWQSTPERMTKHNFCSDCGTKLNRQWVVR